MTDLATLVVIATETRDALAEHYARESDRRSGLAALRPAIDHLNANVLPALNEAKTALSHVGIAMTVEEGWDQFAHPKRGAVTIFCAASAGWFGDAARARGKSIIIESDGGGLILASISRTEMGAVREVPEGAPPGEESFAAMELAVSSFLDAAQRRPTMQGGELRRDHGRVDIKQHRANLARLAEQECPPHALS